MPYTVQEVARAAFSVSREKIALNYLARALAKAGPAATAASRAVKENAKAIGSSALQKTISAANTTATKAKGVGQAVGNAVASGAAKGKQLAKQTGQELLGEAAQIREQGIGQYGKGVYRMMGNAEPGMPMTFGHHVKALTNPNIPGLHRYLTNERVFDRTRHITGGVTNAVRQAMFAAGLGSAGYSAYELPEYVEQELSRSMPFVPLRPINRTTSEKLQNAASFYKNYANDLFLGSPETRQALIDATKAGLIVSRRNAGDSNVDVLRSIYTAVRPIEALPATGRIAINRDLNDYSYDWLDRQISGVPDVIAHERQFSRNRDMYANALSESAVARQLRRNIAGRVDVDEVKQNLARAAAASGIARIFASRQGK